ncbi:MAG: helix-turn-helix transcriptional regulator [Ferruginibacter sp.]
MEEAEIQQHFFSHLKSTLPPNISLADELAEKMGLSHDSIYRRIRGEKPITLPELRMLCQHYHISLDQVLGIESDSVIFNAPDLNKENVTFDAYLDDMLELMKYFNSFSGKQLRYLCKDMTFFQFFIFPEIASFKTFFWIKTIQNNHEYGRRKFSLVDNFDIFYSKGQEILKEYNKIPSCELWNTESINSTLSQIAYYQDSGIFENYNDYIKVIDSFERTIDHLQLQAEKGYKYMPGDTEVSYKAPLQLYVNEVVLGSNTVFAELDGVRMSIITYNVLNYMMTSHQRFSDKGFSSFDNLVSRSSLISATGEKDRNRFFYQLKERIRVMRK